MVVSLKKESPNDRDGQRGWNWGWLEGFQPISYKMAGIAQLYGVRNEELRRADSQKRPSVGEGDFMWRGLTARSASSI